MAKKCLNVKSERGVWYYYHDSSWIPFGDINNEIIEEAFLRNRKMFHIDNYLIDLNKLIEIDRNDSSIKREIKRCIISQNNQNSVLRSERFNSSEKLVQSFNDRDKSDHRFISECYQRYEKMLYNELLEKAANGILKEAILIDKEIEAEWIAEKLRSVIGKSKEEIEKCVIYLYTFESFLYRLLNCTLRENDQSKIDSLGTFCRILFECDCSPTTDKVGYKDELYRGAQLDEKTIESYQQSIGQIKTWDAFSSTSKNRIKAESYGNVLFIINRQKSTGYRFSGMDISTMSYYPDEEEVLIRAARNFIVQNVEKDQNKGKYFIYLLLC